MNPCWFHTTAQVKVSSRGAVKQHLSPGRGFSQARRCHSDSGAGPEAARRDADLLWQESLLADVEVIWFRKIREWDLQEVCHNNRGCSCTSTTCLERAQHGIVCPDARFLNGCVPGWNI